MFAPKVAPVLKVVKLGFAPKVGFPGDFRHKIIYNNDGIETPYQL